MNLIRFIVDPVFQEEYEKNGKHYMLPKPREMDFNAPNWAVAWKKWKQNMEFYLTAHAMIGGNTEEEKNRVLLFLVSEHRE